MKMSSVYKNYEKSQQDQQTQVDTNLGLERGQQEEDEEEKLQNNSEIDSRKSNRLKHSRFNSPRNSKPEAQRLNKSYHNRDDHFEELNISINSLIDENIFNKNAQSLKGYQKEPGKNN